MKGEWIVQEERGGWGWVLCAQRMLKVWGLGIQGLWEIVYEIQS